MATGDFFMYRPIAGLGAPNLEALFGAFRAADHTFANLEGVLTHGRARADKLLVCRSDPELAPELKRAGIDVVTIANNHGMDFGMEGLLDTIEAVQATGVPVVGGGRDIDEAMRAAALEAGGRKIGFMGLASTLPNGSGADVARGGVAPVRVVSRFVIDSIIIDEQPGMAPFVETVVLTGELERVTEYVQRAKAEVDLLVIGIHWGVAYGWVAPFQDELATYQQPLGHALIDAGADAIIGCHSHCLHGVEIYDGRPIFYSLGNTLFHLHPQKRARSYPPYLPGSLGPEIEKYGGVVRIVWPNGVDRPTETEFWPLILDADREPTLAANADADAAIGRVEALSEKFGTRFERTRDILRVLA